MRTTSAGILSLALFMAAAELSAQEQAATSRIAAVDLFKNGLAVIKLELTVPGPGTFRLDDVPDPVHGTWWIESSGKVETAVQMREMEVPADFRTEPNFQEDLAGKKVVVHFKGNRMPPLTGTVLKLQRPKGEAERATGHFLVLKTAKGRLYVNAMEIAAVEADGAADTIKQKKPVLLLTIQPGDEKPQTIRVTYLTHGLGWAPSYRVDLSDPKTLSLELATVIKNELSDLKDAEVRLISGFPSIQMANVRSPLAANVSWAEFFSQLASGPSRFQPLAQQQVVNNYTSNSRFPVNIALDLSATPTGEGVDMHFQMIGKRSLAKGDALSLTLARDKAAYERIIEWLIPDNRDEHGRYTGRGRNRDEEHDDAWDALRFKNPFPFPMTTGPAMVTADGKFNGQRTSYYVNAGEETVLRITKALSIRTRNVEQEEVDKNADRDLVYVGGNRYRKSLIAGEIAVSNHRKENVKLLIRRRFSGDLLSADGAPKSFLREEGIWSVNKRNELTWTLPLAGGEEKRLQYRYTVLVAH
jgi:hypothetical protein